MNLSHLHTVVFDFDNTLFDTERLKQFLYKTAQTHLGGEPGTGRALYLKARDNGQQVTFSLEHFVQVLEECMQEEGKTTTPSFQSQLHKEITQHMQLYDGAEALLQLWMKQPVRRVLLSLGVAEWQAQKVRYSGIEDFFQPEDIIYVAQMGSGKEDRLGQLCTLHPDAEGVLLINDKPDETAALLERFPKLHAMVHQCSVDERYGPKEYLALKKAYAERVQMYPNIRSMYEQTNTYLLEV